ncbi:helix-turn-helix domain-containing protein [Pseudonocardia parietis]|uniref:Transcriptional regulator with XRE-family HTH domain n=1 Tax=Pseudonocardia parietis TaxID=570936 RepID=A0ABS4W6V8_9PSEU|nr:helix-turn-helix transcriptional regulator [Pseudonocardia parietis]MBP2371663.1 transcriptional regulator with XRE-family HTH domain [Pseudonocardia parietis]
MTNARTSGSPGSDPLSGELLRALREETGLSQNQARKAARVGQSSLSRTEAGESRPTPRLVRAVLEVYARHSTLTQERIEDLVAQAHALETEHVDARVVLQAGSAHRFQWRIHEAERTARLVRSYHPSVVIGPLQTREYARAVFTPDAQLDPHDAAQSIDARMERAQLLADSRRRWHMLQNEQALRWPVHSYAHHAAQLENIARVAAQPNISFRVLTLDRIAPRPAPVSGFHLYDDAQALVGTESGSALIQDADYITMYVQLHAELTELALSEQDSLELVHDFARRYRDHS